MKLNLRLTILFILCSLLSHSSLFAQQNKHQKVNASLNIYKPTKDTLKTSYFNLGLLTNIHQIKGIGINLISSTVRSNIYGAQLSGLANISKKSMNGFQLAGIANVNGKNASGMITSGFVNIIGNKANGVIFTGGVNITGKKTNGIVIGGLMNIFGQETQGLQISGLANIVSGNSNGIAISGLMNVSAKDTKGAQIASLLNVTAEKTKGMQISVLGNVSIELKGAQIGLGNYAAKVKGTQIGLVNICTGEIKGVQIGIVNHSKDTSTVKIGLVNINPKTKTQMLVYGGNTTKFNIAARFQNRMTYTMLGVGTHYLDINDKFSGAAFYRAGLHWYPIENLQISGDLGYYHIENFENADDCTPKRMYSLQARINLEYHLTKKFGIFASGGYAVTRYYNKNKTFENKPIIEFGIVLF